MLVESLLEVMLTGSEWVLWLLLLLSLWSIGIMIERALFFRRRNVNQERISDQLQPLLRAGDLPGVARLIESWPGGEATVLRAGLEAAPHGRAAVEKTVHAALVCEQQRLERRLSILGTLGNNAPFIGLFGTVLGIIRAFRDLSLDVKGGASQVMGGISEALVATAVGLFVAIPAVMAYNYFMRRVARSLARAQATADNLMAYMPDHHSEDGHVRQ